MKAPTISTETNLTIEEAIAEFIELGDSLGKNAPQYGWVSNIVDGIELRRRFLSDQIVQFTIDERT